MQGCSGAIASGMGYAIWYYVLPKLKATQAAIVQLSVPILAAIAVLGGIALVIRQQDTTGPSGRVPTQPSEPIRRPQRDGMFLTLSHRLRRKLIWSFWLVTWLGLLAGLVSWQWYGGNYGDRS